MAGGSADGNAKRAAKTARDVRLKRFVFVPSVVLLACANVVFGLQHRLAGDFTSDFELVMSWSRTWLHGIDPYSLPGAQVDYAPMGLVLLSPFAALPITTAVAVWTALHLLLIAVVAILSSRLADFGRARWLFALLIVALPPGRVPLQFSLLCFGAGLAGFLFANRSPRLAGVAIGLSLFKPQIGGPALIWAIAARKWQTVIAAVATAMVLLLIFAVRVGRSPVAVVASWWPSLAFKQNQTGLGFGETSLQPWLAPIGLPHVTLQIMTAATLAAGLVWIRVRRRDSFDLRMFAAACLISLLAIRHLSYDLLLAIPALAFMLTRDDLRLRILGGIAFATFIASPPSLWRLTGGFGLPTVPFEPLFMHAYRAAIGALFLCVLFARRSERLQSTSRASL